MVREVAKGLHGIAPQSTPACPTRVAIELLVVLDYGLNETHLARLFVRPYLGRVEDNTTTENAGIMPGIDDLLSSADNGHFLVEVLGLVDRARLEFF